MTTLREAAKMALEALECRDGDGADQWKADVIAALRAALAEPVQEPVRGDMRRCPRCWEPMFPPQRKPLTEEEIIDIGKEARAVEGPHILPVTFARAIERAHKIT